MKTLLLLAFTFDITWKEAERRETKIKFEVMREAEEEKMMEDSRAGETKKRMEEKMGGQW